MMPRSPRLHRALLLLTPVAWLGFAYGLAQRLWQYHGRGWWAARPAMPWIVVQRGALHLLWYLTVASVIAAVIACVWLGILLTLSNSFTALRDTVSDKPQTAPPMPQPGEWWAMNFDREDHDASPWKSDGAKPLSTCFYIREVHQGWVRYVQNRVDPDRRDTLTNFVEWYRRLTPDACATSQAAAYLRCPDGQTLQGVGEDNRPLCGVAPATPRAISTTNGTGVLLSH